MATLGSYTLGPYRMTYTVEEQKEIVEFARLRGIRIVLELECALILVPSSLSSGQLGQSQLNGDCQLLAQLARTRGRLGSRRPRRRLHRLPQRCGRAAACDARRHQRSRL